MTEYEDLTPAQLRHELAELEAYRQQIKSRRGPEAAHTKAWIRRRKAAVRRELRSRGLPTSGRSFREWARIGPAAG